MRKQQARKRPQYKLFRYEDTRHKKMYEKGNKGKGINSNEDLLNSK